MIYNFNRGIGWASSGVEYAQAYRAKVLRMLGQKAKFIFTDMFPRDNIEHMTKNIGFFDEEVIWLYTFFTDVAIAPVSYTLAQLEKTFGESAFEVTREKNKVKYQMIGAPIFYMAYLTDETENLVHRVEMVSNGRLIRKDYYTYVRIYSEYYAPLDGQAHLYQRRFFNEDGTVAYEEITDNDHVMYQFPHHLSYSKQELIGLMLSKLNLTKEDVLIIDRTTEMGQMILSKAGPAKVISIIHADHFSESLTDDTNILWNNHYEYLFSQQRHIDFFITATDAQNELLRKHFLKYQNTYPRIVTIPVGSLDKLRVPKKQRTPYSLITASRLASEKHIDWLISAVVLAKEKLPELTLDIYGKGGEEKALQEQIVAARAQGYIRLCGQQNLTNIYESYEGYISASTSEGFGLTLMEAVGSGLSMIGFDVRYGNPTFIENEENGYLIPVSDQMKDQERIGHLSACIVRLFTEGNLQNFQKHSYEIAQKYLEDEVKLKWKNLLEKMI